MKAFLVLIFLVACAGLTIDPSPKAIASGDFTLVHSACTTGMAQGLDVCRVVEGMPITETWNLVLPFDQKYTTAELKIRYRGRVIVKNVTSKVTAIPWTEIVGADTWTLDMDAPVQVIGTIRAKDNTGDQFVDILGMAFLVVLQKGYAPVPVDSEYTGWKTDCSVGYTTAGRSWIKCE